jgi:hypothetical protein
VVSFVRNQSTSIMNCDLPFGRGDGVHRVGEIPGFCHDLFSCFRICFFLVLLSLYSWTYIGWSKIGKTECVAQGSMSSVEPTAADLCSVGFDISLCVKHFTGRYG